LGLRGFGHVLDGRLVELALTGHSDIFFKCASLGPPVGESLPGVDAENPIGAFNLYQAMGFEVDKKFYTFRKALKPVR